MIRLTAELGERGAVPALLKLIGGDQPEPVRTAALEGLKNFDNDEIPRTLQRAYPAMNGFHAKTRAVLFSRSKWALDFLQELDRGHFPSGDIEQDELRPLSAYHNKEIDAIVVKYWGHIGGGTPEEKLNDIRRIKNDLRAAEGNPDRGHEVFKKTCEVCHRLYGEGAGVGPDLTHANRQDQDFLLQSIVDPSAVIRKEFLNYVVETTDGRSLTGLIAEQTPASITLIGAGAARTEISRAKIKSIQESSVSLMPEGLLDSMKPQQLRDFFSYLQSSSPPPGLDRESIKK